MSDPVCVHCGQMLYWSYVRHCWAHPGFDQNITCDQGTPTHEQKDDVDSRAWQ